MDTTSLSTNVERQGPAAAHPAETSGPGAGGRAADLPVVLVVDDVEDNLLALEAMLRREDVEILTARSGRAALEILLERDVAVAIVDVMMPEIDGFELAELIRGVDRTRRVPIIFVTAGSTAEYRVFTGYQAGAIDFLFKPLDERVLRAKVDVLVTLERQRRELDRARAETEILLGLAQAAAQAEKPEDVYGPALDAVRDLFGVERSAILLFDDSARMRFHASRGLSDPYRTAVDGHSPWSREERDAEPILISDVTLDESIAGYRSLFAAEGIRAIGFVPLISQHRLLGKLMLYWDRPRAFSAHDASLARAVAAQLAEALERARLHGALRDSEARHRTLLEVSVYGVITIDEDGIIETANPAVERLFGYPVDELRGRNVNTLMPEPYRSQHGSYLENYRRTGERKIIGIGREVVGQRKDGSRFPMDLAVSEFRVGGKRYFKGVVSDITQRKDAEEAREAAVSELKQTLRDNEIFAGVLAHDLRVPLGAMVTAAQVVLRRSEGNADVTKPMTRIVSSGTRMTRLIEQLLDFTRARVGGGLELEVREVDLRRVCGQAVGEIELAHPEWKMKVESLGDLVGTWDPDRLLQVFSNLLANAGQHGTAGGAILVKLDGTDRAVVALEVHNGGSIPEALLPTLFTPFRGTRDRGSQGLGLGLFIAKDIVVGHGGTIEVTSSDAAGTSFKIRLPRRATARGARVG